MQHNCKLLMGITYSLIIFCDGGNLSSLNATSKRKISDEASNIGSQIIGGSLATAGQFPFQIMLLQNGKFQCGGSLISSQWVLTAAHCVQGEANYSVRLGTLNRDVFEAGRIEMSLPDKNILNHERYSTVGYDIALIKLPMALKSSKKSPRYVSPIRLPKRSELKITHVGKISIAIGWGRTDSEDLYNTSPDLKWLNLMVISNVKCAESFDKLRSWNICVDDANNTAATCNGDSGGPIVVKGKDKKYVLIGLNSYGEDDTCLTGPEVFVRVASFLDWIKAKTGLKV